MERKIIEENGVKYEVRESPVPFNRCNICHGAYCYNDHCRIRNFDCGFDNIVRVVDESKLIDVEGKIIDYKDGNKYIAVNGSCKQCAFYTTSKCIIEGYACKGRGIYLMKIDKGGV